MAVDRKHLSSVAAGLLIFTLTGCANTFSTNPSDECNTARVLPEVTQVQRFREAETERAAKLVQEIERLKADLETAEAALIEAESGLSGSHTRAEAVSSLAVARIQIERAASQAPWRAIEIDDARAKLLEAERQVDESRFGAALFFVYRARRVADSILEEAGVVENHRDVQVIRAARVNLRTGPAATEPILSVLDRGTPIFPRTEQGDWILVQVSGGPVGWIHRDLVNDLRSSRGDPPASPNP